MSLLKKLLGKDDEAVFAALEKVRQSVTAWQTQFAALNDYVSGIEARIEQAREAYFQNPSRETLDALTDATLRGREVRSVFTANVGVLEVKRVALTETEENRALLLKACKLVYKRLCDLAAQHDGDERTRCVMIGVEYGGCPTASALLLKAKRLEDEISHLGNLDRPCWSAERVLASV